MRPCLSRSTFRFLRLVILGVAVAGATAVSAWGQDGHRIVGLLAEARLSPVARAEVARLLSGEPEPTLAGVASWADTLRDDPRWRHAGRWHWVNLPRTDPCNYVAERDCPDGDCVIGAIRTHYERLADRRLVDARRRESLKFLVHFVGDIHQPFHAGFAFDRGGNTTQLRFDRQGWNLHSLWDSAMVKHAGLAPDDYTRQLRGAPALPADTTLALPQPEVRWALESCQAIHDHRLYPERRNVGAGYLERHRPLAERRLREAGNRLAALLESALAAPIDVDQTRR